jgi:hypothetical protein
VSETVPVKLITCVSGRLATGNSFSSRSRGPTLGWSKSFGGQAIREKVNPMHTHLIVVLGQLVTLLG